MDFFKNINKIIININKLNFIYVIFVKKTNIIINIIKNICIKSNII